MAYADGELSPEASRSFEERTRREPALAREVVALRRLQILAREAAGPEPMDSEWERIAKSPVHGASLGLGFTLAILGIVGIGIWAMYVLWASDVPLAPKLCIFAFVAGFVVLFWRTYHARARTLPYDAYTKVKR
jgi:anti-sigma factor RsiW